MNKEQDTKLSPKAAELLFAAKDTGWILHLAAGNGTIIGHKTGLRVPREIAEWREALDELKNFKFVEKKSDTNYQLEAAAYRWIDANEKK